MPKVVILGGGILGLYAAYRLSKKDFDVTVLEKSSYLGGALRSYEIDGYSIEQFYHHFFTTDSTLIDFLKDIGMEDKIIFRYAINGFYNEGSLYPLFKPSNLLKFRPLSIKGKIGLAKFMLSAKLIKNVRELDGITAREWIIKVAGQDAYRNFFEILLRSKFGENRNIASAAWFLERINMRSHVDKNGEKLGYLDGGFGQLVAFLKDEIEKMGCKIHKGVDVKEVSVRNGKAASVKYGNSIIDCDYVISSIPPSALAKIVEFPAEYENRLSQLEYQPALCILIGLDKNLTDKFYWVNMMKEKNSFGAFIEHTNFIPKERYNNTSMVYLASYVEKSSELMTLPEEEVFKIYFNELKAAFPKIDIKNVRWWRVARDFNAGLIYKTGILKLIPEIQSPIKNIFIGGMFNSYPERSISKSVEIGREIVEKIISD